MTTERNYSKAAMVLAAGALLISAGNAGVPALAGAMAGNADKVDGFDAVKSTSSVKHRKGNLVATSPKNGRLPNNIIKVAPNARKLGGHPLSFFLGDAEAAAVYETSTHAAATYQTKADATAGRSITYSLPIEETAPPTASTSYILLAGSTLNTPAAGRLRVSTAFTVSDDCGVGSITATWLTVDGEYLLGSLIRYVENVSVTAAMTGISAGVLAAGNHSLEIRSGCLTGAVSSVTFFLPSRLEATLLPGASVVGKTKATAAGQIRSGRTSLTR